jgi:hypothetical protein
MKALKILAVLLVVFMAVSPVMADGPDDPIGAGPVGQDSGEEVLVAQDNECQVVSGSASAAGFIVCYVGNDGNKWTYTVTSDNSNTSKALSHVVFGFASSCAYPSNVTWSGGRGGYTHTDGKLQVDPTSQTYGYKLDNTGTGLGDNKVVETSTFVFTFDEQYAEKSGMEVATKAGNGSAYAYVTGPDCSNVTATSTPVPTDEPTVAPTDEPTVAPTDEPTATSTPVPTDEPTATPTDEPTATPTATPTDEPAPDACHTNSDGFTVCFISHEGNEWTYTVTSDGDKTTKALSHVVFGLCAYPTNVTTDGGRGGYTHTDGKLQVDPTTGTFGYKMDTTGAGLGEDKTIETTTFVFTLDKDYGEGTINVATKAGTVSAYSQMTGPDCDNETTDDTTAIALKSFTTEAQGNTVVINWETAAEIDNAGFNIYRANALNGQYEKVNDLMIGAQGDLTGAVYSFEDTPPADGVYFYVLEDVDTFGLATSYEPVQASLGATLPTLAPTYRPMQPAY